MTSRSGTVGGVAMPHAPQFFILPETEDLEAVERIRVLAGEIGEKLARLEPDVWVVIANDHVNQFFLHCAPPFTFHHGLEVRGSFAGREFHYSVAGEIATNLIQDLQADGFDPAFSSTAAIDYAFGIPLTFLGVDAPILPIYVNSYVPPQPAIERCYALGRAIDRAFAARGVRAVVVASGGLSHFPGTDRYANPDVEFDEGLIGSIRQGNLRSVLALDNQRLDETGNVELRSWAIAAGMLGERTPDVVSLEPSWHHTYATVAWHAERAEREVALHYPTIHPERVAITQVLYRLANDPGERKRYIDDPEAYASAAGVSDEETRALVSLDEGAMSELGVHPLPVFLVRLYVGRQRAGEAV